jgi:D-amino-acid dehydrogenase
VHVLVIGGGVVGLTTAYHLIREGASVTLVDARATGLGASIVNAGWLVPAEAAPMPGPGVVRSSLKWMLRPDSPLYIKPSTKPAFLSFMFGLWRVSNAKDQRGGFAAHLALADGSLEMFDDYRAEGISFEMHSDGLLMAFAGRADLENHLAHLDLVEKYGLEPVTLVGDAVREHEPILSDAVLGGLYFPKERHLVPGELATSLRTKLVELGAEVVESAAVNAVEVSGDHVRSVRAGDRTIKADRVVLAAGAWSGDLSKAFGYPLPVRPGKGYSVDVPALPLRSATNLWDAHVAVTPFDNAMRIAGTIEFGGLDETINPVRVDAIMRGPTKYFRDWEPPSTGVTWRAGMRPMTPDNLPIIGRLGRLKNGYVSTGHGSLGVTLAPASAAAITELILRDRLPPVLERFTSARFRGGR